MAKIFPLEAKIIAFKIGISFERAISSAASEEKGRIVAARNADTNRTNSCIRL